MPKDNSTDSFSFDDELSPGFYSVDFYQKRKKGKYRLVPGPDVDFAVADTHCHVEMFEHPEWVFIRAALHNVKFLACVIDSIEDGFDGIDKVEEAYCKASKQLPEIIEQINNSITQINEPFTITKEQLPELCLDKDCICKDPKLPELVYICGAHPHNAKYWNSNEEKKLYKLLDNSKTTCIGEIGLDFHYDLSPRETQIDVFKHQIKIAKELNFPVSLHIREAHDIALDIFNEVGFVEAGTLLHCFNLGPEDLKPWVNAGCYIAIGGPVTFKKSDYIRDSISLIPADKLLTETDAPFMTPEPLRGDVCFPDHVIWTAKTLMEVTDSYSNKENFYNNLYTNAKKFLGVN